ALLPPVGGRAHLRLAHRAPPPGPRLRTRPRDLRGLDPLGRDQHHPAGSPAEGPPPGSNDAPSPPQVDLLKHALSPEPGGLPADADRAPIRFPRRARLYV